MSQDVKQKNKKAQPKQTNQAKKSDQAKQKGKKKIQHISSEQSLGLRVLQLHHLTKVITRCFFSNVFPHTSLE